MEPMTDKRAMEDEERDSEGEKNVEDRSDGDMEEEEEEFYEDFFDERVKE